MRETFGISSTIHQAIAEAIVKQSHPAYDVRYQGMYYVVDTDGDLWFDAVVLCQEGQFAPWHDKAVALPVADLFGDLLNWHDLSAEVDPDLGGSEEDAQAAAVELALSLIPDNYEWSDYAN